MKVLAIDIGTSSVRSALFNARGRMLRASKSSSSYHVRHAVHHAAELDPALLLRATRACVKQTQNYLTKHERLTIAASCFWHSLLGLDRSGDPLTPIYTWADARCVEEARCLRQQLNEATVQQRTGCMLRASFWPAKLIWLQRSRPSLFRKVARWVSPGEWIMERLFGAATCSHSMASGTGLYHLERRQWDEELLAATGMTPSKLNPIQDRAEIGPRIIFAAIGDGAAGNLGSGAVRPGLVAINVGTSAAIRTVAVRAIPLPFGFFRLLVDEKRSLLGGAISNAGSVRAWCLRQLRLPDKKGDLEELLRASSGRNSRLTILPFLLSERAPTWPEDLCGAVTGLNQSTTAADLLVTMVRASFNRLAAIMEDLEAAAGRTQKIIVSGGIVQSPASLQMLADSLGRRLEISAEQEASLRGAAVFALEKLGYTVPAPKIKRRVHHRPRQTKQRREEAAQERELERWLNRLSSEKAPARNVRIR